MAGKCLIARLHLVRLQDRVAGVVDRKQVGIYRIAGDRVWRLGSISEVVIQVALLRAQRHIAAVYQLMQAKTGVFAKVEAALIYTARELPTDPAIVALIARHSTSVQDPRVHAAAQRDQRVGLDEWG